ncbi:transposase [Pontibacter sp. E15-1]|uniref:transposase n=1 Tax=Pontibacter sp. E15-1 TaxID=2919918 RepID=UPI001F4FE3BC|nr:transposase [Pontibacter sp. E15-1]MCJ8165428.1 transposase [Pontibacter sp. E15-1]
MSEVYYHYWGSVKAAYAPRLLLSLLFYGYATGVFSSRRIEAATHDSARARYTWAQDAVPFKPLRQSHLPHSK